MRAGCLQPIVIGLAVNPETIKPRRAVGRRWLELTDGQGAEALLPLLLEAAPLAGADPAPVAAALDAVVRDKSQTADGLDRVRQA
jgi:hypothetical protein